MTNESRRQMLCAAGSACLLAASPARAQTSQVRPVRIVVPLAPGGGVDAVGRLIAGKLSERLGQPVVVDNRPGAGGSVGADAVAKSAADGYTLLYTPSGFTAGPALIANLPYDIQKDFSPISMTARVNLVVVVPPSLPVRTLAEFIAYSKSRPGTLNYGTTTNAMTLAIELFKDMTGADLTQVSYRGSGQALSDFLGGQVHVLFDTTISMLPQIKAGKARALAVTGARRSPAAPDIPSIAESGFPDYDIYSWQALLAPAKTSPDTVRRLNEEVVQILKMPDVAEKLQASGTEPVGTSQEELAAIIARESSRWTRVAQRVGIKPQ